MEFPTEAAASNHLMPMSAGTFNDVGGDYHGFHCGFSDRGYGYITKTDRDRNGINLHLLYADGSTDIRNVNPHMNVFYTWKKKP